MTRVATTSQNQFLLLELQKLQRQQFETQQQISTGKKTQYYKDIANDSGALLSAKAMESQTDQFRDAILHTQGRLEQQNIHLTALEESARDLHETVLEAASLESGITLMADIQNIFQRVVGVLNTRSDGEYIYSGTRTDVAAVSSNDLNDLVAAANAADLFQNNDIKHAVRIDTSVTMEVGVLADEVATPLFDAMKRIADYNAGPFGPFGNQLTVQQRDFLAGEVATLNQVAQDVLTHVGLNGVKIGETQEIFERHEATDIYLKSFISDIEDADVAAAIVRLNQEEVALEATMNLIGQLSRLSLIDFIR